MLDHYKKISEFILEIAVLNRMHKNDRYAFYEETKEVAQCLFCIENMLPDTDLENSRIFRIMEIFLDLLSCVEEGIQAEDKDLYFLYKRTNLKSKKLRYSERVILNFLYDECIPIISEYEKKENVKILTTKNKLFLKYVYFLNFLFINLR